MKKIRFVFVKKGLLRFISHLDLNRTMIRALRAAGIPVGYSQGFNPRPLLTFALPLSLGIESECETMDVTVTVDDIDIGRAVEALNSFLPPQLRVTGGAEAVLETRSIAKALYLLSFPSADSSDFRRFWERESIIVTKKTKSGEKQIDLKALAEIKEISREKDPLEVLVYLPAGAGPNINPVLLAGAFAEFCSGTEYAITRKSIVTDSGEEFR